MILAGDVGGTHTRLAFFETGTDGALRMVSLETVPSRAHVSLDEILTKFAGRGGRPVTRAAFGVAGPVRGGRSETTNLPWVVDGATLARTLGIPVVTLLNDLEANAYGIAALGAADVTVLQDGEPDPRGNQAVIAAGTGLGEAGLTWDGEGHRPFATEGGHADFAPLDDLQIELLRFLQKELGHVSVERVLSGPGLYNVYRFLRDTGRGEEPAWLAEALRDADHGAVISQAALAGRSALCREALDLVVAIYAAEAGNLALKILSIGGVYIGGGIAPRFRTKLEDGSFVTAFRDKGRFASLMETMPVHLVLEPRTALLGAARVAQNLV